MSCDCRCYDKRVVAGYGIGDNQQYLEIWDLSGGSPVKRLLPSLDAHEWCQRDPSRYRLFDPANPSPPQS